MSPSDPIVRAPADPRPGASRAAAARHESPRPDPVPAPPPRRPRRRHGRARPACAGWRAGTRSPRPAWSVPAKPTWSTTCGPSAWRSRRCRSPIAAPPAPRGVGCCAHRAGRRRAGRRRRAIRSTSRSTGRPPSPRAWPHVVERHRARGGADRVPAAGPALPRPAAPAPMRTRPRLDSQHPRTGIAAARAPRRAGRRPLAPGPGRGPEAARWRRLQVAACGWADRTLCVTPQDRDLLAAMGGTQAVHGAAGHGSGSRPRRLGPGAGRPAGSCSSARSATAPTAAARGNCWKWSGRASARHVRKRRSNWPVAGRTTFLADAGRRRDLVGTGRDGTRLRRRPGAALPRCHAFAAPLTEGGGIKIKVLEALARGVPVVTTAVGAEGIATADGTALLRGPARRGIRRGAVAGGCRRESGAHAGRRRAPADGRTLRLGGHHRPAHADLQRPARLTARRRARSAQARRQAAALASRQRCQQRDLRQPLHRLQQGESGRQVAPHRHGAMAAEQDRVMVADVRQHRIALPLRSPVRPRDTRAPCRRMAAVSVSREPSRSRPAAAKAVAQGGCAWQMAPHVRARLVDAAVQRPFAGRAPTRAAARGIDLEQVLDPQRRPSPRPRA